VILCLNTNAALDQVLFIERFEPNTHMRTINEVVSVGGKGLATAMVLHTLGAPVIAVSFVAGRNGQTLEDLLRRHGIANELIWMEGETRVATVIVETDVKRHSHITSQGYTIASVDCQAFLQRTACLTANVTWAVIAGTLPPGAPQDFYALLTTFLHERHVHVLVDAFGVPLCAALAAVPDIVKMNLDEFIQTFGLDVRSSDSLPNVCRTVMARFGLRAMVITCGKDGILACTPEGDYLAGVPEVNEVNAAGAGDAVSASLVYRLSLGDDWKQALSWAAATAAAVVLTPGTAECHLDDVLKFYPCTWVKKLIGNS
jgi:1-phosphofructokinase family hexose kinase